MNSFFGLFLLSIVYAVTAAHDGDHPDSIGAKNEDEAGKEQPEVLAPFSLPEGEMLLLEWLPFPINKYRYIVLNATTGYTVEEGVAPIEQFTEEKYPHLRVALAVVPGDGEYIYLEKIPVISVDAFRNDRYFQEYQDIIFTIHEFTYKVELWAHFLRYQDAFCPVRDRLSEAFQEYLTNPPKGSEDEPPKVIQEEPPVADFVEKQKDQ